MGIHITTRRDNQPLIIPSNTAFEDNAPLSLALLLECQYLDGTTDPLVYETVQQSDGAAACDCRWTREGFSFSLADRWCQTSANKILLERRIQVKTAETSGVPPKPDGFQLHLKLGLSPASYRFFAPGMVYSPDQYAEHTRLSFCDHRLAYPLVAAYNATTRQAICLSRVSLAKFDRRAQRSQKEKRFLQSTDIGALGFVPVAASALEAYWPYDEGDTSALLDAQGSPATALYPLEDGVDITLVYEIATFEAEDYADAVFAAFRNAYALAKPQPPQLHFTLQDAIHFRLSSLENTYHEWNSDGAGFVLNFDPEKGYRMQARAFGASFTNHQTGESQDILEYGFTGRQISAAFMLAEYEGGQWVERGRRVLDFFIRHMTQPSGWVFTLYHLRKQRPLYTVGDLDGPVLHYLARANLPGNYTRMMVEAMGDVLLFYQQQRRQGHIHDHWLAACHSFAQFLVRYQNADGSWYRAYTSVGEPLHSGEWFGTSEEAAKSATCIPVPYLLSLADELGMEGEPYREAVRRACSYVLNTTVAQHDYRGGTLDNPNVVDKEAALLTMRALLALYEHSGDKTHLEAAEKAARLAITWNFIWNVPNISETPVGRAEVKSTGWGGINSIWGAGVTDIYSLFFLEELVHLSRLTHQPLYEQIADLIANGTQQILSYPQQSFGFVDVGMQPEGIAFCDQGVDAGLIAKGDIWGGLGWIYTAGTFGLKRYLSAKEALLANK